MTIPVHVPHSNTRNSTALPIQLAMWLGIMLPCALLSGLVAVYQIAHSPFHEISSLPHRFDDFMIYWHRLPLVHQVAFYSAPDNIEFGSQWGYPAPAIWIYRLFYLVDPKSVPHPTHGFALMEAAIFIGVAVAAVIFFQACRNRGLRLIPTVVLTVVAAVLPWPFLFAVQRGNIELLLWLPLAAALWSFHRRFFTLAAILIGISAAAKIYPLILLALFIPSRRFLHIALGLAITVFITILSLWYIGPTLSYAVHHLGLGVSNFIQSHGEGLNWNTEGFNHSFFHLIKIAAANRGATDSLQSILPRYMAVAAVVMTLVYFIRVLHLPFLNQLAVLTLSMVYLPATSYDYTLQILLLPWAGLALLIIQRQAQHLVPLRGTTPAMVLFALILGPELFLLRGTYCYAGTVKSICLGALLILACVTPWPSSDDPGLVVEAG